MEHWFYFDLYASGRLVGQSRIFKITGSTRAEACAAAEEAWLASGGLRGNAFELFDPAEPTMVTLRDHPDSPTQ